MGIKKVALTKKRRRYSDLVVYWSALNFTSSF